ncbi:hypothetical protein ElyMa_001551400 [Elysia marginata]|uniref:THAP-type domain-containing protein n=1 Tax=Elysia marginata TaxID=1093978 RepID=A0AAV4JGH9_9GAST|nr:hypothetical protein ElyMa_001551400 [Elysia marginata]
MRLVHQMAKTLTRKQSQPAIPVKDQPREFYFFTQEKQLARWKEHFEQPLNRPPPENPPDILPARSDLPIHPEPPSKEKIAKAIKALKLKKICRTIPHSTRGTKKQICLQELISCMVCLSILGNRRRYLVTGKRDM